MIGKNISHLERTLGAIVEQADRLRAVYKAACGLHLQFGNRVVTSTIRKIEVIRLEGEHIIN